MTTVINLNFFKFNLNKSIVDDFRLKNLFSDRKQNYSSREDRVIDITSRSRVLDDGESSTDHRFAEPHNAARLHINPSLINITYDRHGNIIQYFQAKGVHVDSYV